MTRKSGVTLVELLVVIGIIAIVAAITTPVVRASADRAKVASSLARGKQTHLALMLYREDNGGVTGSYGEPSTMNLPFNSHLLFEQRLYGLTPEIQKSPCGQLRGSSVPGGIYQTVQKDSIWARGARVYEENVHVTIDFNCSRPHPFIESPQVTKRAVVTTLGGRSYVRVAAGPMVGFDPWCDLPN